MVSLSFVNNTKVSITRGLKTISYRILAVSVQDATSTTVQVVICVYMPCFQGGNRDLSDEYVVTIDSLQTFVDDYGTLANITIMGELNVKLPLASKNQGT